MEKFKIEHPDLHSDLDLEPKENESPDEKKPNIGDPDEIKPKIEEPGKEHVPDIKDDDIEPIEDEPIEDEEPVIHPDQQKPPNKIEGSE